MGLLCTVAAAFFLAMVGSPAAPVGVAARYIVLSAEDKAQPPVESFRMAIWDEALSEAGTSAYRWEMTVKRNDGGEFAIG